MRNEEHKSIELYPNIIKYIGNSIISFLFTLGAILLIIAGFKIDIGYDISIKEGFSYEFTGFLGVIGLLMFGFLSVFFILKILVRKPSAIIDQNGVYDNSSFIGIREIKWSEIKDIIIYEYNYRGNIQKSIAIEPKEINAFFKRYRGIKKVLMKTSKFPILISEKAINMEIDELYELILEFWKSHR